MIWSFGPDLRPVLEVEPGDVVTFETNDCFTGQIRSEDDLVTEIDLTRINSATGPIAVRGAEPARLHVIHGAACGSPLVAGLHQHVADVGCSRSERSEREERAERAECGKPHRGP